ncbi:MAG: DoxX family protein [Acidobacteria bacterium]|nr:DoxX family protein [Acidobacteriota bacterium]MBV9474447.1 DoxX family protein [Acidobacteriota bacterium]
MNAKIHSIVWTLRIAFGLTAFLAGLDKFFNLLTNWEQYANPMLLKLVPLSAGALMRTAGVIEMIAGIALLAGLTRLGGYVVAAWLTLIALTLIAGGHFFDVAVRDLVMAVGAFTLARMSEVEEMAPSVATRNVAAA